MAAQPLQLPPQQPKVTFVDRPELTETFADSTPLINFDNSTFRVTFAVTRPPSELVANKQLSMNQYPSARIVMPLPAGLAFANQLQQLINAMIAQGAIKPIAEIQPPSGSNKPN